MTQSKFIPAQQLRFTAADYIAHGHDMLELLIKAADYIEEFIECAGGCDHSVGICACEDYALLEAMRDLIQHLTEPEAWLKRQIEERRQLALCEQLAGPGPE